MSVTIPGFREAFPVFSDPVKFPTPEVQFWFELGGILLDVNRWGDLFDYGLQLFMAHNLATEYAATTGAAGGTLGGVVGAVTSASVDKVSYSRDPQAAMDPANGHWNLTIWGLKYIRLVKMVGAGPIQVGVGVGDTNWPQFPGWPGIVLPDSN